MVTAPTSRGRVAAVAAGLVLAVVAVYWNSLDAAFVFDDPPAILENQTIRRLWPLTDALLPPHGQGITVEGRPVLNLTLALNYAVGGTAARGYHVFNVVVHALATLTLFGLVRNILLLPALRPRFGAVALPLAALIALLWALHPLQTESVTYVIQRAEAMVSGFYLLTLYCFVRGAEFSFCSPAPASGEPGNSGSEPVPPLPGRATVWFIIAVVACFVGMATKEIMVSAPLVVLLFDRVFMAGSWGEAWRCRGRWHLALFSTWVLLGVVVISTGTRGGTAGFGINVTPWAYALTQCEAVSRYVWLALWPHPLIFDYGVKWAERASDVLPYAAVVLALIGGTILAWRRWPAAAWLGVLFFAVLSPTSSIVPGNRQTMAEHRMYLPLATIVALGVCGAYLAVGNRAGRRGLMLSALAVAAAFGALTVRRNADYRSELALYHDTAIKRPQNGFARYNYAKALAESGRHAEAVPAYEVALPLLADAAGIHYNLANSLVALSRKTDAVAHYEAALRQQPRYARAHFNFANLLVDLGRKQEAAAHFAAAIDAEPDFTEARANLGGVLLELGQLPAARTQLEAVLRTDPHHVPALFNLGNVCLLEQRWDEAARNFEAVITLRPDLTIARDRLDMARNRRAP